MNRWPILILILIAAALLRVGYQQGMLAYGGSFHNGSDSGKYLAIADTIYDRGEFGRMTPDGFQEEVNRMPVYPYFLAGVFYVFGKDNLHAVVLVQVLVDIGMILGLMLGAAAIDRRLMIPTAAVAAIIPNFLVHASYILTETVFTFFLAWGICASLWALRGRNVGWLLASAGACFGMTLLTRPVMMFFPVFLFATLLVTLPRVAVHSFARRLMLAALPAVVMVIFAAPRVIENYIDYGAPILTNQSGVHLLKWVYPCLRTPWSCSSLGEAWEENAPIVEQRISALPKEDQTNPAKIDLVRRELGMERIRELGPGQVVIGFAAGMFKNLIQTGFYETLAQYNQPATFLSAMPGNSVGEKLANFIKTNRTNVFMMLWAVSQTALLLSRVVQLIGVGSGLANTASRPFAIFLGMTIVYFLLVSGPVANPKYRIPTEPGLIIFFSIGLYALLDWLHARSKARTGATATATSVP